MINMVEIHKFGGSSQTKYGYDVIIENINMYSNKKRVIVVSAISNITNLLIEFVNEPKVRLYKYILDINNNFATELNINISDKIEYFKNLIIDVKKNKREIIGFGEYFTAYILSRYLKYNGIDNIVVDNTNVIFSNKINSQDIFNNGEFKVNQSEISKQLEKFNTVVIPGFGGLDLNNNFCLMGRGGSDTTGSIIASSLNAEKYFIWTDVNGLYTIDPNINKFAQIIKKIDYNSAQELAAMGAKVIHPFCILPCLSKNIPIFIKNTYQNTTDDENTIITNLSENDSTIYSVTRQKNVTYFKITSMNMWNNYGFVSDIFKTFSEAKIDVNIINTSQFNIATTTDENNITTLKKVKKKLEEKYIVEMKLKLDLISIVGNNIHQNKNLDNIFSVVKNKPIIMTSYSSNDRTISFLVNPDNNILINLLHNKLFGYNNFDNIELNDIVRQKIIHINHLFNSPFYCYDAQEIYKSINNLKKISSIDSIHYAIKANDNPQILEIIKDFLNFECVSLGEINKIRNKLNYKNNISFTPNFCKIEDYIEAFKYNNINVVIDNIQIILKNLNIFSNKNIGLRLDLNMGHGHHDKVVTQGDDSKFGITVANFKKYLHILIENNINIVGIHTHMGSGINNYKFWVNLLCSIKTIIYQHKNELKNLQWINLGGGFGLDNKLTINFSKLDLELREYKDEIEKILCKKIKLKIEPGRYIIAKSGYIIGQITQFKTKNKTNFVGCNIGMNDNIRPALYNSIHPVKFITDESLPIKKKLVNLVGPICESGDVIIKNLEINSKININDIVVVLNAGAYCESMASQYNCRKSLPSIIINQIAENINKLNTISW